MSYREMALFVFGGLSMLAAIVCAALAIRILWSYAVLGIDGGGPFLAVVICGAIAALTAENVAEELDFERNKRD